MHTGIKTALALSAPAATLLALAACGGGGGGATTSGGAEGPVMTIADLILPQGRPADAGQSPAIQFGNELRVGTMPPPAAAGLASAPAHGQAAVRHGRIRDGVGASALAAYLQHDATGAVPDPAGHVRRFPAAPAVRFVTGTTAAQAGEIVRAVQLLNANLPRDYQLAVDPAAVPDPGPGHQILPHGQILVEYDRREDWEIQPPADYSGLAQIYTTTTPGVIAYARVWVDHTRLPASRTLTALVHELDHALGRLHPDPGRFPGTIMQPAPTAVAGYVLHPLDREALLAVHGALQPGTAPGDIATDLGPWEDESLHVRGDLGDLAFGAALRNGLVRPWAAGPRPGAGLADNAQLSGSASWSGRLLGLTPAGAAVAGAAVAGAAALGVDLAALTGDLDFTELESWAGAPGAPGSGTVFGDGDLNYGIAVRGNTFARASGDAGAVTGVFFGAGHEGKGGTLVRDDLSAGFAGTR